MPKKIKRGRVGRPPTRHHPRQKKKITRPRKQKSVEPVAPSPQLELTVEQENLVDDFARRVLKVRQIKCKRDLFEQMNQIRKYVSDSCIYGDLKEIGQSLPWDFVWIKLA